jgi:type I restriction enzyme S subunit
MTEGPYKLPEGWRWLRLGEACEYERRTIDPSRFPNQEFLVYSIPAYDNNKQPEMLKGAAIGSAKLVIQPNVCLFSKLNPRIPRAWVVKRDTVNSENRLLASTEFMPLRPRPEMLDVDYLGMFLITNTFLDQVRTEVTGATGSRQRLKPESVLDAFMPLPPLSEQRRIAARIEELMGRVREARRLRQEAQKDAERLWQSVLAQTFPRPGSDLPEGWRWVRLGEVAWRDAITLQPRDQPDAVFHYLGMEHVAPGQWDEPTPVELRGAEIKSQVIVYRPGLVLYGKLRPYLNKVVVPSAEGIASTEFVPIAVNSDVLEPRYLGAYLRSPSFVAYATRNTTGSRQPRMRLEALWGAIIPLPPLAEQHRIVAHLQAVQEKIKALKEAQAATEAELKRLEQAILEKAFRGEL